MSPPPGVVDRYQSGRTPSRQRYGVPGRIMGAIQFFEAQIDDQLLTRAVYDHLLSRHGFTELGSFSLTPMHAVTHARKPR
jgi:hypothetical protein